MHAILTHVKLKDPDAASAFLESRVVPMAKAAPGLLSAYWWKRGADGGGSFHVFDTKENATAFAEGGIPPEAPVELISREVVEIDASA
jgi:hypothetical protein